MRRNVRVLNGQYLVAVFALDPFGGDGGGGDGGSTSKGFEFGILDDAVGVHFDLKLHYIATGRCSNESRANIIIILIQRSYIPRIFIMFYNVLMITSALILMHRRGESGGDVDY